MTSIRVLFVSRIEQREEFQLFLNDTFLVCS
nr:MAG TPA: hypothetical protein [Caudoviricetes sp.]